MSRTATEATIIKQHFGKDVEFTLSGNGQKGRPDAWVKVDGNWQLVEVKDCPDKLNPGQQAWHTMFRSMTGKKVWILYRDYAENTHLLKSLSEYLRFKSVSFRRLQSLKNVDKIKSLPFIIDARLVDIKKPQRYQYLYEYTWRCTQCSEIQETVQSYGLRVLKSTGKCTPCTTSNYFRGKIKKMIVKLRALPFLKNAVYDNELRRYRATMVCPDCRIEREIVDGSSELLKRTGYCIPCFNRRNAVTRKRKTHCSNGHEFTPDNTRLYKGYRVCKQCRWMNNDKRKAERKLGIRPNVIPIKERCKRGHARTPDNVNYEGGCKQCAADLQRQRRLRRTDRKVAYKPRRLHGLEIFSSV